MLRVGNSRIRKLYRCSSLPHHLLDVETSLTNDQSMMLRRQVDGNVHYHWLLHNTLNTIQGGLKNGTVYVEPLNFVKY